MKKKLPILIVILTLLLILVSVTGCTKEDSTESGNLPAEQGNGEVSEKENDEDEGEKEVSKSTESWIKVESTNGAYKNAEPLNWNQVGTQNAHVEKYSNYSACFVYIANFETTEVLRDVALEEGQAVAYFVLTLPPESDPEAGSYDYFGASGPYRVSQVTIRLPGGTNINLSPASMTTAEMEVTEVMDSTISGRFNIEEKWTQMSGEFQVAYE
ncbi:hypothetical protein [Candidatus Contubernalis alkaliaceticus]|uniref:hypothetical protein n=1 Tax=Candidatus Contubernalis alkaliaceticus TaxID=338645 RepID=UPI001F4C0842|nr:hypothetical protein [Candidatus Contubernalis alkalaceticus]UNC92326.1 hypothetical protein HUE98_09580 [Candidatus Contubernalis alkalaceticus]